MIHIETKCAKAASAQVREAMNKVAGPWLVWSAGDEGLCMALNGSREARAIRKYWPELEVGVYDSAVNPADLASDIAGITCARALPPPMPGGLVPAKATRRRRKPTGRPRSKFSLWVSAADALACRAMTVDQMAETLAVDRDKARNVIAYLMQSKRAHSERKWDVKRRHFVSVYRAVA